MIWKGIEEELKDFLTQINEAHPSIKFDTNYTHDEIKFLDTNVKITDKNQLVTTLYVKLTDRNTFIHHTSYHPPATKKSTPYSQAMRLSRKVTGKGEIIE